MWTKFQVASLSGIGICAIEPTTGGIVCQDNLTRPFEGTSPMTTELAATTGVRSLTLERRALDAVRGPAGPARAGPVECDRGARRLPPPR